MSINRITTTFGAALLVAVATQLASAPPVTAGKCFDQTGCSHCCPECNHCCRLDAEMGEEEKKCFEVETEVVCIPRVVFPWQVGKRCFPFCGKKKHHGSCDQCDGVGCSACVHNGAKTRKVKILKSRKYKCPKCEYTWTPEPNNCRTCCDGPGCCDGGCEGGYTPAPAAEPVPAPVQAWENGIVPDYTGPRSAGLESVEVQR